jgi:hypothetical protein
MTELEERALTSSRIAIATLEQEAIKLQEKASQLYDFALRKTAEVSLLKAAIDDWESTRLSAC